MSVRLRSLTSRLARKAERARPRHYAVGYFDSDGSQIGRWLIVGMGEIDGEPGPEVRRIRGEYIEGAEAQRVLDTEGGEG